MPFIAQKAKRKTTGDDVPYYPTQCRVPVPHVAGDLPRDIILAVRQLAALYGKKPLAVAADHYADVVLRYDAAVRCLHPPAQQDTVEVCRLCGRNGVPLYSPWTLSSPLTVARGAWRSPAERLSQLLGIGDTETCQYIGRWGHFDPSMLPLRGCPFLVSPRVCLEDVVYFFRPGAFRMSATDARPRRAVSWPSRLGAWLSSGVEAFVLDVWRILPDSVRDSWRVVRWWLEQRGPHCRGIPPCVRDNVAPCTVGPPRSVLQLWDFACQHAESRCSICPLSLFADEVEGMQLLALADWQWLEDAGPTAVTRRLRGDEPSESVQRMRARLAVLRPGWDSPWPTIYRFTIWTRVWVCDRRGLMISTCAYCTTHPRVRHFVTPRPDAALFHPPAPPGFGHPSDDPPSFFQPATGMDLSFLGLLRLQDLTLKTGRVCYRGGDLDRPGNIVFRVLKLRGDTRGVSTTFFTLQPQRPSPGGKFGILLPTRTEWIAATVRERPDLADWWQQLKDAGVLADEFEVGADVRVPSPEATWLAEAAERARQKAAKRNAKSAGCATAPAVGPGAPAPRPVTTYFRTGSPAALPAAPTPSPMAGPPPGPWDKPHGIVNLAQTCYVNALLQVLMAMAPTVRTITESPLPPQAVAVHVALRSVLTELERDGACTGAALWDLWTAVLAGADAWGLRGLERDVPVSDLCAREMWALLAGTSFADQTAVTTALHFRCVACGGTRMAARAELASSILLPLPDLGAPSVASLLQALTTERALLTVVHCPTCGCSQQCAETTRILHVPSVLAVGIQQVAPRIPGPGAVHYNPNLRRAVTVSHEVAVADAHGAHTFRLHGVIRYQPGHWVALVRGRRTGRWYCCDDLLVTEIPSPVQEVCHLLVYLDAAECRDDVGHGVRQPNDSGADGANAALESAQSVPHRDEGPPPSSLASVRSSSPVTSATSDDPWDGFADMYHFGRHADDSSDAEAYSSRASSVGSTATRNVLTIPVPPGAAVSHAPSRVSPMASHILARDALLVDVANAKQVAPSSPAQTLSSRSVHHPATRSQGQTKPLATHSVVSLLPDRCPFVRPKGPCLAKHMAGKQYCASHKVLGPLLSAHVAVLAAAALVAAVGASGHGPSVRVTVMDDEQQSTASSPLLALSSPGESDPTFPLGGGRLRGRHVARPAGRAVPGLPAFVPILGGDARARRTLGRRRALRQGTLDAGLHARHTTPRADNAVLVVDAATAAQQVNPCESGIAPVIVGPLADCPGGHGHAHGAGRTDSLRGPGVRGPLGDTPRDVLGGIHPPAVVPRAPQPGSGGAAAAPDVLCAATPVRSSAPGFHPAAHVEQCSTTAAGVAAPSSRVPTRMRSPRRRKRQCNARRVSPSSAGRDTSESDTDSVHGDPNYRPRSRTMRKRTAGPRRGIAGSAAISLQRTTPRPARAPAPSKPPWWNDYGRWKFFADIPSPPESASDGHTTRTPASPKHPPQAPRGATARDMDVDLESPLSSLSGGSNADLRDADRYMASLYPGLNPESGASGSDVSGRSGDANDILSSDAGAYEAVVEEAGRRDTVLQSGLVHMLFVGMPHGPNARWQRRNKKWSDLLDQVQARAASVGTTFWDYLPAYVAPYHYRQRTPEGHFVGCMPSHLYCLDSAQTAGFTSPERMVYEKMLGLEGPEAYDPAMWSFFFSLLTVRKLELGTSVQHFFKRGMRDALYNRDSVQEYHARFGDDVLPGLPASPYEARDGVQELARLNAIEGPCAYFVTFTLAMNRMPGVRAVWEAITAERNPVPYPHLPYLSRCWRRALRALLEWIMVGQERPFGLARLMWWRVEFEIGQGAANLARGNLEHAHALLWTRDPIMHADPGTRAAARRTVSDRVTAELTDFVSGVFEQAMGAMLDPGEADELHALAEQVQHHTHSFSCLGKGNCPYPQWPRDEPEYVKINIMAPENLDEVLAAMDGVMVTNPDTGERRLVDELQGGKNVARRGAASVDTVALNMSSFRATGGCHQCAIHTDTSQFRNTYLVKYQAGEDERTLIRVVPRDKDLRRLYYTDRNIRKRTSRAGVPGASSGTSGPHNTRESMPEAELVTILEQHPMSGCMEVVDEARDTLLPVDFVHFSTALPSERYVSSKPPQAVGDPDDPGPTFGGPTVAEEVVTHLAGAPLALPARCTPSLGQLRVYVRNWHSPTSPDKVAAFNLGPPALCASVLPYWVFMEVAVACPEGRLCKQDPAPWQRGLPRGLWAAYDGLYGLRGERWKLRPAFFYHERYRGWPEAVFCTKMQEPDLLAAIRAAWRDGVPPPPRALLYVDWARGRCVGVTRPILPAKQLRWLVHKILLSDTPFDDEQALYEGGVRAAARRVVKAGQPVLAGTPISVLQRFLQDDLVYMGKMFRSMWNTLAAAEPAIRQMLNDDDWGAADYERYRLPLLEEDLDADHAERYRAMRTTVDDRHQQALASSVAHTLAARNAGAPASSDGLLVRAHPAVHGFAQSDASWAEQLECYDLLAKRLRDVTWARIQPGAELQHRDGPWVQRRYVNPILIAGPPGSGKSKLTQCLMERATAYGLTWETTTTTANIAVRNGGVHLHVLLGLLKDDSNRSAPAMAQHALRRIYADDIQRRYLQDLDVIFFEEIGTCDDRLLTVLDLVLQDVRRSSQPFGGVYLVVNGDPHQIKPVRREGQGIAMESLLFRSLFSSIVLREMVRIRCPALTEVQRLIRKPRPSQQDADRVDALLRQHCHPNETPPGDVCVVRLFAHRACVENFNTAQAERVADTEKRTFPSQDREVRWARAVPVADDNKKAVQALDKGTVLLRKLTVWKGMQVMFRGSNPDRARGLVNCAVGIVTDFSPKDAPRDSVSVLLRQPLRREDPMRITPWECPPINGPSSIRLTRRQIPLVPGDVWTQHMGIGLTLSAVATDVVWDDPRRRMWERGQLYMVLTRVSRLRDIWLLHYDRRLVDYLLSLADPGTEMVDEWINDTRLNGRRAVDGRPRMDPPGMSARMRQFLSRPCRTLGGLEPPPDSVTAVYLLQQMGFPYFLYWGYSANVRARIQEHNSNGPRASKRTRGRTDWMLAAFVSPFPNTRDGFGQAKAARHWAKEQALTLESALQHRRHRTSGVGTLWDCINLAHDLSGEWNERHDLELRVVSPSINFDALQRERTAMP